MYRCTGESLDMPAFSFLGKPKVSNLQSCNWMILQKRKAMVWLPFLAMVGLLFCLLGGIIVELGTNVQNITKNTDFPHSLFPLCKHDRCVLICTVNERILLSAQNSSSRVVNTAHPHQLPTISQRNPQVTSPLCQEKRFKRSPRSTDRPPYLGTVVPKIGDSQIPSHVIVAQLLRLSNNAMTYGPFSKMFHAYLC